MNKTFLTGVAMIIGYVTLSSIQPHIIDNIYKLINSGLLVVFVIFLPTALIFLAPQLKNPKAIGKFVSNHTFEFFLLNLTTAGCWIGCFLAIQKIGPTLETFLALGSAPVITLIFSKQRMNLSRQNFIGVIAVSTCIILSVALTLLFQTQTHFNGKMISGITWALISGMSVSAYLVISKRLHENGVTTTMILATRYPLLLFIAAVSAFSTPHALELVLPHWKLITLLVIVFMVAPLFLVQGGLRRTNALATSILIAPVPMVTAFWSEYVGAESVGSIQFILIGGGVLGLLLMRIKSNNSSS